MRRFDPVIRKLERALHSVEYCDAPGMHAPGGHGLGCIAAESLNERLDRTRKQLWQFEVEMRALFGRTADEPLPDFTKFPTELFEFESIPGTYFDAFPLLLLTRRSLDTLAARAPDSQIDVRRFRPNLLIGTEDTADFPEIDWVGKRVAIGEAELAIRVDCPRCVMTTHGFADLPRDPQIMRRLVQEAGGSLGVYASVEIPGTIRVDDEVRVLG